MADNSLDRCTAYVYAVLVDGVVRYIGKGTKERHRAHLGIARAIVRRRAGGEVVKATKFYNRLAKAVASGSKVESTILIDGLTEAEAYNTELLMISGLPAGQVWNFLRGGLGVSSEDAKRMFADPAFKERHRAGVNKPESKDRKRQATFASWRDPESREKRTAGLRSVYVTNPGRSEEVSAAMRIVHANSPERAAAAAERMKAMQRDPEFRRRAAERNADPEIHRRIGEAVRKSAATEDGKAVRARATAKRMADPATRAKLSAAVKAAKSTPEARAAAREKAKAYWARKNVERRDG